MYEVWASKKDQNQIRLEIKNITNYPLPVKLTSKIKIADLSGSKYKLDMENVDDFSKDGFWLDS